MKMTVDTPRGRSLYSHLVKSYFAKVIFIYNEKQRLNRLGVPFLSQIDG